MRKRQRRNTLRGDTESAAMRKWEGAPRTGYGMPKFATGGEVGYGVSGPVMMASALTSRSHDPDHAVEDAGPLATMPEGAPSLPEEQNYRRGGSVRRKTGYQEGGDVEDDEEPDVPEPVDEEELPQPSERPPPDEGGEEGGGEEGGGPAQQQQPPEEEGEEGGGEGRGAPTGYNAPPQDQADRDPEALRAQDDAAQEPVGFQPQQARQDDPEQQLREALDWTRKQFGLDKGQHPQQQPQPQQVVDQQEPLPERAPLPGAIAPLPPPPTPAQAPEPAASEEGRPPPVAPQPQEQPQVPMPQARPQGEAATQPQAVSGVQGPAPPAGASQQLTNYLKGERNFTPEQMTQLLDRATQENPHLDQSGSIRKAFQDLMGKGDIDGASRFVQALRPSYDNLRAAMVAATGQGKFVEALQIAEKLNNLIPNGNQVSFHPTENGLITAIVRPENGEAARTYHLSPQQFQDYAKGAGSVFDIAADKGIDATLQAAMQGPAQNPENAPPYQVAGPMMPPPTGGTAQVQAPPGTPMPQPRPAEAGPAATPEAPLAQAQRIAAGLPGQAPAATPQPAGAGGDRVQQLQQQPQRQAGPSAPGQQQPRQQRVQPHENINPNYDPFLYRPGGQILNPNARPGSHDYVPPGGRPRPDSSDARNWTQLPDGRWQRNNAGPMGPAAPSGGDSPRPVVPFNTLPDGTRQTPTRDYAPGGQYYGKDTGPRANDLPGYRPQTGYQNSPARQQGTFDPATNTYRPAAGSAQPPQQRGPQADPDKPGRQLQQPQQTQPQPNQPRPAPTQQELERKPGQYFGTREQKAEQYKKDYEDYKLQDRAYRQYPADPDKQARALERLRSDAAKTTQHQEDLRYKETPQQKDERERYKQGEQNKRSQNSLDALKYRTDMSQLGNLVREREGNAFKQLLADQTRWAKDNPGKPYQFKPEEDALIARMRETATKNDLYEQLRPRIGNNPGTTAPVEVTKPTARDGAADLETYRGDATPKGWDIPKGWTWGRSKSTGKWEARPSQPSQ